MYVVCADITFEYKLTLVATYGAFYRMRVCEMF